MRRSARILALVSIVCSLAACGRVVSVEADRTEPGDLPTREQWVRLFLAAQGEHYFRCEHFSAALHDDAVWQFLRDLPQRNAEFQAALDHGRLTFRPEAARDCLAALAQSPCSDATNLLSTVQVACELAAQGHGRPADTCVSSAECESGWCISVGDDVCKGQCFGGGLAGTPCGVANEVTNACDHTAGLLCVDGTCAVPGETCNPDFWSQQCAPGSECDSSGSCVNVVGEPPQCGAGLPCDGGRVCVQGKCQMPDQVGAACDSWCGVFLDCKEGVCVEPPEAGEPCFVSPSGFNGNPPCRSGLFCGADGSCHVGHKDGPCTPSSDGSCQCEYFSIHDTATGVCRDPDAPCTKNDDCLTDFCLNGKCADPMDSCGAP
ncbi:MAG: hypothetical protein JST92_00020 [Deltaproteobacteria bacterium]|nr:hypothetical protein [Deltaproteobacteria bacterium]